MCNRFLYALKDSIFAYLNSPVSSPPKPGSLLERLVKNPKFLNKTLQLIDKYRGKLLFGEKVYGIPYAVSRKLLMESLSALMSSDSVVQPCNPTIADKARNTRQALRYRWFDSGSIALGSIKTEVPPEFLPTALGSIKTEVPPEFLPTLEFLVELFELLELE